MTYVLDRKGKAPWWRRSSPARRPPGRELVLDARKEGAGLGKFGQPRRMTEIDKNCFKKRNTAKTSLSREKKNADTTG